MDKKQIEKDKYLRKKYGISLDQYNQMVKDQNDACKICKKHKSYFKKSLNVDHDHKTGEVRGALCYYCNNKLVGRHDKISVKKLVEYILPEYQLILVDEKQKSCQDKKRSRKNYGKS